MRLMAQDKKVKGGKLAFVLVHGIGEAFVGHDVSVPRLTEFLTRECAQDDDRLGNYARRDPGSAPRLGLLLGSETALTGGLARRMHALEQDGNARAASSTDLLTIRERFIGAILLGNNLANIAASALATSLFLTLFGKERRGLRHRRHDGARRALRRGAAQDLAIVNADRMALAVAPVVSFVVAVLGAGDRRHAVPRPPHAAPVRRLHQRRRRACSRRTRRSAARSTCITRKAAW